MSLARILLADDHELFREGLAALINTQPDLAVAGQAERLALPPDEKKCWQELGEVDSPQHLLNAADFYWREAHILVVGRVP